MEDKYTLGDEKGQAKRNGKISPLEIQSEGY